MSGTFSLFVVVFCLFVILLIAKFPPLYTIELFADPVFITDLVSFKKI